MEGGSDSPRCSKILRELRPLRVERILVIRKSTNDHCCDFLTTLRLRFLHSGGCEVRFWSYATANRAASILGNYLLGKWTIRRLRSTNEARISEFSFNCHELDDALVKLYTKCISQSYISIFRDIFSGVNKCRLIFGRRGCRRGNSSKRNTLEFIERKISLDLINFSKSK